MEIFFGLLCLFVVVTVVGHGIWVGIAAFVRLFTGPKTVVSDEPQAFPDEQQDMAAMRRQLNRLVARGLLTPEVRQHLIHALRGERVAELTLISESPVAPGEGAATTAAPTSPAKTPATTAPAEEAAQPSAPSAASPFAAPADTEAPAASDAEFVDAEFVDAEIVADDLVEQGAGQPPLRTKVAPSVHPLDRPEPIGPAPAPRRHRTLAVVLQAFMEEKSIRWGEIISGLLIVVSATGLVISLWATLRESVPYLPALIFMVATAAFHASGHYTLRKWQLGSISRSVLVIGMLLIPLNFLAAIALSHGERGDQYTADDPLFWIALVVGTLAFGAMAYFASRALVGPGWPRMFVGVMGASLGQVLINRVYQPDASVSGAMAAIGLALVSFLFAATAVLWRGRTWRRLSLKRGQELFLELGIALFAFAAALGLLLSKGDDAWRLLSDLSPALSLVAATILATGLTVHQRTTAVGLATLRTGGTAVALLGACGLLTCVVFAWPQPEMLITVGVLNGALLASTGFVVGLPALHVAAAACGAVAWVIGFHWLQGGYEGAGVQLRRVVAQSIGSGETSAMLVCYAALLAALAGWLHRSGRILDRWGYLLSSGLAGLAAVGLALWVGFTDSPGGPWAVLVLAVVAVAGAAAGAVARDGRLTWLASALLLAALVQALRFVDPITEPLLQAGWLPLRPILVALLAHAVVCVVAAAAVDRGSAWRLRGASRGVRLALVQPLIDTAFVTSAVSLAWVFRTTPAEFGHQAIYVGVVAAVWLSGGLLRILPLAIWTAHGFATLAIAFAVASWEAPSTWGELLVPGRIGALLIVLALWCGASSLLRWALRRDKVTRRLLPEYAPIRLEVFGQDWTVSSGTPLVPARWIYTDQVLGGALVGLLLGTAAWESVPSVLLEFGAEPSESNWWAGLDTEAVEPRLWWACVAVAAGLIAGLWERFSKLGMAGLVLTGAAVPLLAAAGFESVAAGASALRWWFGGYALLLVAGFSLRGPLARLTTRAGLPPWPDNARWITGDLRRFAMIVTCAPVLLLTTAVVVQVSLGGIPGGPAADCMFARMGLAWSYATPMAAVVAALLVLATSEGRPTYALAGSLVFQYLASLNCLLPALSSGGRFDERAVAELGQWNATALGLYALVWLGLSRWIERNRVRDAALDGETAGSGDETAEVADIDWAPPWLNANLQVATAVGAVALLALAAVVGVAFSGGAAEYWVLALGEWLSYAALVLTVAAAVASTRHRLVAWMPHLVCGTLVCTTAFVAASLAARSTQFDPLGFHALLVGGMLSLIVATDGAARVGFVGRLAAGLGGALAADRRRWLGWVAGIGGALTILAIVASGATPRSTEPWWATVTALVVALAATVCGARARRQWLAYASILLVGFAAFFAWRSLIPLTSFETYLLLVKAWIAATALGAVLWQAIDLTLQRRRDETLQRDFRGPRSHRFFAYTTLAALFPLATFGAAIAALQRSATVATPVDIADVWGWLAVAAVGLLLIAGIWDALTRRNLVCLYFWGMILCAAAVDAIRLKFPHFFFACGAAAAVYVLMTCVTWRRGIELSVWGRRWGVPNPIVGLKRVALWLPASSVLLSLAAILVGLVVVLNFPERPLRFMAAAFPALCAVGTGALAQAGRRGRMQLACLLLAVLSGIFASWADIDPEHSGTVWLDRVVRLLIVCCLASFIYAVPLARALEIQGDWRRAVQRAAIVTSVAALTTLISILLLEVALYLENPTRGAPIDGWQLVIVSLVMIGLIAALLAMALSPARDPLGLSESGRQVYVYAAQATGGLIFAHIYLTRPEWFGQWSAFWPYIVMGIAFAGAGVGELAQRSGLRVLADPLQRTGTFLPLIPVIGMWMVDSAGNYALLLFVVGLLYVGLSITRKSLAAAVAAGVAGNGALWSLLHEQGFELLSRPQMWMIPPAASVLIAAEINRRRLPESALTSIRYAAVIVIYLSSAGEMFIRGIGEALWPPMVLLLLSVIGALLGVVMRIRAFLYLGSTFIFLSVVSMVWHAARAIDKVWPWWAFVFALGLALLILFGVFEKHRERVKALIEELRRWEK